MVVNHHLLAADLSVRQAQDNWEEAAVLPPYQRLVLDEAHHLEDVAAGHLGVQVSSRAVRRLLARFERNGRGLAPTLAHELMGRGDLLSRASLDLLHQRLLPGHRAMPAAPSDAMFLRLYRAAGRRARRPAPPGRRLRRRRDLGRGPRVRARRDARRVPRAAGIGGDDRRPAGRVRGDRAARRAPAGAAGRDAPARRDLRRPQPDAAARPAAARPRCAGWSARRAAQSVSALGGAARPRAGAAGAALRPARHRRPHQRHAGRRRRLRLPGVPARTRAARIRR